MMFRELRGATFLYIQCADSGLREKRMCRGGFDDVQGVAGSRIALHTMRR